MRGKTRALLLLFGFLALVAYGVSQNMRAARASARSVAEVKRLGGKVALDKFSPESQPLDIFPEGLIVDLPGTATSDGDLGGLQGLSFLRTINLNLARTRVSDAGLHLVRLPIAHLDLSGTAASADGVAWLARQLPRAVIVTTPPDCGHGDR